MYLTKYKKYSSSMMGKKAKNCALRNHLKQNFSLEFSAVSLLAKKYKSRKAQKKLYSKFILPTYARIVSKGCCRSGGDTLAENVEEPPFAIKFKEKSGQIVANVVDPEEKSRSVKFSKEELEKGIYVVIGSEKTDQKPSVKFLVEKVSNSKFCDSFAENILKAEKIESDDDLSFKSALSHITVEPVKEKSLNKNNSNLRTEKKKIETRKKKKEKNKCDEKKLKKIKRSNKTEEKNDMKQVELNKNSKPGGAEPSVNYLLQLKNFKKIEQNRAKRISTLSIEKSMINLLEKKDKKYLEERKRLKNERNMTSVSQVLKGVASALKPLQDQLVEIKSKMNQYKGCPDRKRHRVKAKNAVEQIVDAIMTADGASVVEPKRKPSLLAQEMKILPRQPSRWYFDPSLNDGAFKCCHVQESMYDPMYEQTCHNYNPHMTTSMTMIRTQRASNYKF